MRVLVVEDEVELASLIRRGLREEGLLADVAVRGEDALWMAAASPYDVLTLDARLPGIDGFEVCRRLRDEEVRTPILMLTALDDVEDRIAGLDAGADDYLVKPFDFGELVARLRALARRGPVERDAVLRVAGIELDPAARRVRRNQVQIPLSAKEFQLLEVFMRHPDQVLAAISCSRERGTANTSTARTSSTSTCATCARSSTGPSVRPASRPSAAWATACGAADEDARTHVVLRNPCSAGGARG
jgi:two-component system OmpR family response regulator